MPNVNPENFEIGEGDLSLKFEGEANATDVGGCIGSSLEIKVKDLNIDVGQYMDPVDTFDIAREILFSTTMKEDTMRNFVTAMGGDPADIDDQVADETYEFPANSVSPSKFAELIYSVPRVRNKNKIKKITLYRVKTQGGIKYDFNKDKEVQYKVTWMAFADPDNSGSPGKIEKDKL